VQVTLRRPPPLGRPIDVAAGADAVAARVDGAVVAEAVGARLDIDPIEPVSYARASEAALGYRGLATHPFPTCFACGTARSAPDGLALRPGAVPGRADVTAAPWSPDPAHASADGRVPDEIVWAALDCPGGWTVDLTGRPAVLGRITASVDASPGAGDRCVVMGSLLGLEGRKAYTATTLYDSDGRVLARAHACGCRWTRRPSPDRPDGRVNVRCRPLDRDVPSSDTGEEVVLSFEY
jgi:hypothetical protein